MRAILGSNARRRNLDCRAGSRYSPFRFNEKPLSLSGPLPVPQPPDRALTPASALA